MSARTCKAKTDDGSPCRANPQRDTDYCYMHDPAHTEEMAEARRLGGLRRRKEKTVAQAYDIGELDNVSDIRRVIQIATLDTLALENSIARSRTLAYLAGVSLKALEVSEIDERLRSLEAAMKPRQEAGRRR